MKLRGLDMRHRASAAVSSGSSGGSRDTANSSAGTGRRRTSKATRRPSTRSSGQTDKQGIAPLVTARDGDVTLTSEDGTLAFRLKRLNGGVHVERTRRSSRSIAVVHVSYFDDEASFIRWCDSDRLRFTQPLLLAEVRRCGRDLFRTPE